MKGVAKESRFRLYRRYIGWGIRVISIAILFIALWRHDWRLMYITGAVIGLEWLSNPRRKVKPHWAETIFDPEYEWLETGLNFEKKSFMVLLVIAVAILLYSLWQHDLITLFTAAVAFWILRLLAVREAVKLALEAGRKSLMKKK